MPEKFSLKDELFHKEKIYKIASEIKETYLAFKKDAFIEDVLSKFPELELKERLSHIAKTLRVYMPSNYRESTTWLLVSLPLELNPLKTDNDFGDFIYASYAEFILIHGCNKEDIEFSLEALAEMTKRFSVEFAIRDFINEFPIETLKMLDKCSVSVNYHQRRLASEGTRPRLPWGKNILLDYRKSVKILDNLFYDKTRFVTRSVANHLNDIAKIDASLVIETLKRWKDSHKQNEKEMDFILHHSLRTLVKEGNVEALELLGYSKNLAIKIENFSLNRAKIKVGEALDFSFNISTSRAENLIIDYIVFFKTKTGKLSTKVYKLKKIQMKKDEFLRLSKKYLFKANQTTRKLYAGNHKIALQINGKVYKEANFSLEL
jgi:3-methyladenine DNA glycosylase AlkC